jgi:hypothetical protein
MYKEIEPLMDNTICEARIDAEGNITSYRIRPAEDCKLHEVTLDEPVFDEGGNETGETKPGFTKSYVTAGADYDFKKNERQIYSILA